LHYYLPTKKILSNFNFIVNTMTPLTQPSSIPKPIFLSQPEANIPVFHHSNCERSELSSIPRMELKLVPLQDFVKIPDLKFQKNFSGVSFFPTRLAAYTAQKFDDHAGSQIGGHAGCHVELRIDLHQIKTHNIAMLGHAA